MNWDGTENSMPFSFSTPYDLYFYQGFLGFNTFNGDTWGIYSSGLANRWVFVAAVFSNGDVTKSELYIDGTKQNCVALRAGPNNANAYASTSGFVGAGTSSIRFFGKIDNVRVYTSAISFAQIEKLYAEGLPKYQLANVEKQEDKGV